VETGKFCGLAQNSAFHGKPWSLTNAEQPNLE